MSAADEAATPTMPGTEPRPRLIARRADVTDPNSALVVELRRLTDDEVAALPGGEIDASGIDGASDFFSRLDYALFKAARDAAHNNY
jgi:hypothetical protein